MLSHIYDGGAVFQAPLRSLLSTAVVRTVVAAVTLAMFASSVNGVSNPSIVSRSVAAKPMVLTEFWTPSIFARVVASAGQVASTETATKARATKEIKNFMVEPEECTVFGTGDVY